MPSRKPVHLSAATIANDLDFLFSMATQGGTGKGCAVSEPGNPAGWDVTHHFSSPSLYMAPSLFVGLFLIGMRTPK